MIRRATFFIMIFTFIFSASILWSQTSPSKVGTTDDNYAIDYNNGPCIDRAPNGMVVCIWATGANHNNAVLWSSYDDLFGFWNTPQALGTGTPDRTTPALTADNNNNFHAIWSDDFRLMYAQFDGATWSTPVQVYNDTINANESSIVIGSDNKIWVAWSTYRENDDINEWLFISNSSDNGATWSDPDTLAKDMHPGVVSSYFCFPYLAAGLNGKIGVAYRERDNNVSASWQLYLQEYNGSAWSDPELLTTFSDSISCYQASIAYDSKGRLHSAFYTHEGDWPSVDLGQIYYTWKDEGGSWSDPVAITSEATGKADYPAIAVGPNDALYVAYLQNSYTSGSALLQVFAVTSDNRGLVWGDTVRISDGTVNMPLRGASLARHPQPAGVGGTSFEGGADLLWVEPDDQEVDGYSLQYGRIPWVERTDVKSNPKARIPSEFKLSQNYPNPFNPTTTIEFQLSSAGKVQLQVYDMLGKEVASLMNKELAAGIHQVKFDASSLASGIYFYKVTSKEFTATKKMIIMK